MPGIDKNRLVGLTEEMEAEFTCGICHGIFDQPVVTPCCQQTYCKDCIGEWIGLNSSCPNDRRALSVQTLTPAPRTICNLMANFNVRCRYFADGCQHTCALEAEPNHVRGGCEYNPERKCRECLAFRDLNSEHNCIRFLAENGRSTGESVRDLLYGIGQLRETTDTNIENGMIEIFALRNEIQELKQREEIYNARIDSLSSTINTLLSQVVKLEAVVNRIMSADGVLRDIALDMGSNSSSSIASVSTISYNETQFD